MMLVLDDLATHIYLFAWTMDDWQNECTVRDR